MMIVITDYTTPIHRDMFVRQISPSFSDDNQINHQDQTAYGKPQNRFKWLPVYVILGPVWEHSAIAEFYEALGFTLEFATGVPEAHREPWTHFDATYVDWETGEFITHKRAGWTTFALPTPGAFKLSDARRIPDDQLPPGDLW